MPIAETIKWYTPKEKTPEPGPVLIKVRKGDIRHGWAESEGKIFVGEYHGRLIKRYSRWAHWPLGEPDSF